MTRNTTFLLLALGIFAWSHGWLEAPREWLTTRALDHEEQAAIELQCRGMGTMLRDSCEQETTESLVAGDFDPEPILRVHCTRFDNLWAENIEIPPDLCIERYGGWLHG